MQNVGSVGVNRGGTNFQNYDVINNDNISNFNIMKSAFLHTSNYCILLENNDNFLIIHDQGKKLIFTRKTAEQIAQGWTFTIFDM